jgi:hypothetical protein
MKQRIRVLFSVVLGGAMIVLVSLFLGYCRNSLLIGKASPLFDSGLPTPTFESRLATPTAEPKKSPTPTPSVGQTKPTPTPVGGGGREITFTVVSTVRLPMVKRQHPFELTYEGSKGNAGIDNSGLITPAAYYNWGILWNTYDTIVVRMIECLDDYSLFSRSYGGASFTDTVTATAQNDHKDYRGRVWLVLNEPDNRYSPNECGLKEIDGVAVYRSAITVAHRYTRTYNLIKNFDPSARVFVGGVLSIGESGPNQGRDWWSDFVGVISDAGQLDTIEGVHVHGYPGWSKSCPHEVKYGGDFPTAGDWCMPRTLQALEDWYSDFHVGKGLADQEIWVTEIGASSFCTDSTIVTSTSPHYDSLESYYGYSYTYAMTNPAYSDVVSNVMNRFQNWYDGEDNPGYDKLFWFHPYSEYASQEVQYWCTFMHNEDGTTLSAVGEDWTAW